MVSKQEFMNEMAYLLDVFPALKNRTKLERIYNCFERIPLSAVAEILERVGDDAKHAPSISEFKEAAGRWRRDYHAKHGHYYGETKKENAGITYCDQCGDSGILEIYSVGTEKMNYHMRCTCHEGKKHWALLPEWDKSLRQAFYTKAPALENFKPVSGEYGEIMKKYYLWKDKLNESFEIWSKMGFVP